MCHSSHVARYGRGEGVVTCLESGDGMEKVELVLSGVLTYIITRTLT
jgi:hypothetical protein